MGAGKDQPSDPSLMRNLGAFFGHIVAAIRENPDAAQAADKPEAPTAGESETPRVKARIESQEVRQGEYVLRRTTIDEVLHDPQGESAGARAAKDDVKADARDDLRDDEANRPCQ